MLARNRWQRESGLEAEPSKNLVFEPTAPVTAQSLAECSATGSERSRPSDVATSGSGCEIVSLQTELLAGVPELLR